MKGRRRIVPCALILSAAAAPAAAGELSFEKRVEAQRAIEAVHFAHRLQESRSFEKAVPHQLIERRVRTSLRQSLLLERQWNTPVTAAALRAELRRIADGTLLPRRLEEIYAALGHDPVLIEETFTRAALVDRLARRFFSVDRGIHAAALGEAESIRRGLLSGSVDPKSEHERRTVLTLGPDHLPAEQAVRLRTMAAAGDVEPVEERPESFVMRTFLRDVDDGVQVAVYTVPKMTWESWWERIAPELDESGIKSVASPEDELPSPRAAEESEPSSAAACHPQGQWINGSLDDPGRASRAFHSAVWTGQLMLIWGGESFGPGEGQPAGERYDPLIDTWSPMSTTGEPPRRSDHTAVWTGSEMIVWGGDLYTGVPPMAGGGRYDPVADTWAPISITGAPSARVSHTAVWTGSRMAIWGGLSGSFTALGDGALYDPAADTWSPISPAQAPSPRYGHTATWTGSLMVVWGATADRTGGRYDPEGNTWSPMTTVDAPPARDRHTAVWTGSKVIVWGGIPSGASSTTGGLYDPAANDWDPTPTAGAPDGRTSSSAVWTGTEMIIWGGGWTSSELPTNTGGRFDPASGLWRPVTMINGPGQSAYHSTVWTGSLMIVWGGMKDGETINPSGGRYDPEGDLWTPLVAPSGRQGHTAVWTGNEMIVWGGSAQTALSTGARYDPLTDIWIPTSMSGAPAARGGHTAVWTGSEMLVWGGSDSVALQSGARYDPGSDTWSPISTFGAPQARNRHQAVWTGSRMIVWGGDNGSDGLGTGGRYDPTGDSWTPTSLVNAPAPRTMHTAVWTGSEMIVWGGITGFIGGVRFASGGRYDPVTDEWSGISTVSVPSARYVHHAIWTGSLMVIWSGNDGTAAGTVNGGRYHPGTDTWRGMSTSGGPTQEGGYAAAWTGTVMIVWGGTSHASGGSYHPSFDTWSSLSLTGRPMGLTGSEAVWDGEGVIFWGWECCLFPEVDLGGRYVLAPDTSADIDGDGSKLCAGDCDDSDPFVKPGGAQICDGKNNDCSHPWWPDLERTNEVDADGDARSPCQGDCNDGDASVWGTPTDTRDLTLDGPAPASLTWEAPATPGAQVLRYDTLRSTASADFGAAAVCVESNGADLASTDAGMPPAGSLFYYLVRAENACPGAAGIGPLRVDSSGVAHPGRSCP